MIYLILKVNKYFNIILKLKALLNKLLIELLFSLIKKLKQFSVIPNKPIPIKSVLKSKNKLYYLLSKSKLPFQITKAVRKLKKHLY